jgi:hypothetical protein
MRDRGLNCFNRLRADLHNLMGLVGGFKRSAQQAHSVSPLV